MKITAYLTIFLLCGTFLTAYAAPDKTGGNADQAQTTTADNVPNEGGSSRAASTAKSAADDLLLQAMSLLGVAYRFGGNSPETGLDCSGFIRYIFQKALKVNLPRTAAQMAHIGQSVEKNEIRPGDLVFFNTRGFNYSHVGLYMGNGRFIHSPRAGKSVEFSELNASYWRARYNGARRVNRSTAFLQADTSEDSKVGTAYHKPKEPASKRHRVVLEAPIKKAESAKRHKVLTKKEKTLLAKQKVQGKKTKTTEKAHLATKKATKKVQEKESKVSSSKHKKTVEKSVRKTPSHKPKETKSKKPAKK